MKRLKILRILIALLIAADMAVIFSFSSQRAEASQETSSGVIVSIVRLFHSDFDSWNAEKQERTVEKYQHAVRKAAHMTEFASLGALFAAFFYTFGFKAKNALFAFLSSAAYAAGDEVHQLFVPGRSGQLTDVLIDGTGALLGVLVFTLSVFVCGIVLKRTMGRRERKKRESIGI